MANIDEKIKELGYKIYDEYLSYNGIRYRNEDSGITVDIQWADEDDECIVHAFESNLISDAFGDPFHESIGLDIVELQLFIDKIKEMRSRDYGMVKHNIGENVTAVYPAKNKQTVLDIPYIIQDYRDEFHYDDKYEYWVHNDDNKIWASYNNVSESFMKWYSEKNNTNVKGCKTNMKSGDKITGRYGNKSVTKEKLNKLYGASLFSNYNYTDTDNIVDIDKSSMYIGINDISKINNPKVGPDILSISEYRLKVRMSNYLPMEIRYLPKADILFQNVLNDCLLSDERHNTEHIAIPSPVDPYEIMVSKDIAIEFINLYRLLSDLVNKVGNEDALNKYRDELRAIVLTDSDIFKLIQKDYIEYIIKEY